MKSTSKDVVTACGNGETIASSQSFSPESSNGSFYFFDAELFGPKGGNKDFRLFPMKLHLLSLPAIHHFSR